MLDTFFKNNFGPFRKFLDYFETKWTILDNFRPFWINLELSDVFVFFLDNVRSF